MAFLHTSLWSLLILKIICQIQGLQLNLHTASNLTASESDSCSRLICKTQGESVSIQSIKMIQTKPSGESYALLRITTKNPTVFLTSNVLSANGTLVDNMAVVYLDMAEVSSCLSDYFICEVTYTKTSGETGNAFSVTGPGQCPSHLREGLSQPKSHESKQTVSTTTSARGATRPYNSYASEVWFLGEKLTKVEEKFATAKDRLEQKTTQSVSDIYKRTNALENTVLARVSTVETDFSGRISRLEDRMASKLLSEADGQSTENLEALAALRKRVEDVTLTLKSLNESTTAATTQEGSGSQKDKPSTCYRGMGDDITKDYTPYVILTHDLLKREILCDTKTMGGGWIVIQRRGNGNISFFRDWSDYKTGFGLLSQDFWLGNEAIHKLSDKHPYELRIDFRTNSRELYAHYTSFRMEAESDNYRLRLGTYSGSVGEKTTAFGLSYHNGHQFSTFDRDNDPKPTRDCAVQYHGGWWYNDCYRCNLNGKWRIRNNEGARWHTGDDTLYFDLIEMKMRRI